jgi:hypothetical protein
VESVSPYAESPGRNWWQRSRKRAFKLVLSLQATEETLMKPGLTARADVLVRDQEGLLVPRRALVFSAQGSWVRVLRDGSWEQVPVELEALGPTTALSASGLGEGDRVELQP